jgi:hypothetical protein
MGESAKDDALPADLRALVEGARRSLERVADAEAAYVYSLALMSRAATGRTVQGGSAIDVCAAALGLTRQTVQPYAVIASRWNFVDLRRLLSRRTVRGRPLSTAHLLFLARLGKAQRGYWLERTVREGLDVHSLRALVTEASRSDGELGADGDLDGREDDSCAPALPASQTLPVAVATGAASEADVRPASIKVRAFEDRRRSG